MQTFLPYPDFAQSARCLDRQRLGKQRVEVLQLLKALLVPGSGWSNHPAAKMWRGFENRLVEYGIQICREWTWGRGYEDTCWDKIIEMSRGIYKVTKRRDVWVKDGPRVEGIQPLRRKYTPSWLGDPAFHAAHRSNLLRKNPEWYGQFGWTEPNDLPYVWPTVQELSHV